jgi:periplasmic protein TonB
VCEKAAVNFRRGVEKKVFLQVGLINLRAVRCLDMNTITFDDGLKRQFALPAAIVLGAHAVLFLGFSSHPSAIPPLVPVHSVIRVDPLPLPVIDEYVNGTDKPVGSRSSQPQPPDIQNPVSPEQPSMPGIPITTMLPSPHLALPGPWSPSGDPIQGIGPGGPPVSSESLDRSPESIRQPQPIYPLDARIKGENGEVVAFVVDESGRVSNARVVRSSDPVFEEPTLRAIEKWRFAPGTLHGVPVRFRMSVPVAFNLEG